MLSLERAAVPVVSPLAVGDGSLRRGVPRTLPVYGLCVHTTGSGPATRAKREGRSPLQIALDYYVRGGEGYPHYLIDYDGTIRAICDEGRVAWHAGWFARGGKKRWGMWVAPAWWSAVWRPRGIATPANLLPAQAGDPNSVYIGVELLADSTGWGFTSRQYDALARLVADVFRRHGLPLTQPPNPRLLGHEDLEPVDRANASGGWDPGAHRTVPKFSWSELWARIQGSAPAHAAPLPVAPARAASVPTATPPASAFTRHVPESRRWAQLLPLLDRYRGEIPLVFLLGWVAVESDARIDVVTSLDERGFFQIHPAESKDARPPLQHLRLSTDPAYSVQAGIQIVRSYASLARRRFPWIPVGSELFWRIVKLQHAMGSGLAWRLLQHMRSRGIETSWEAIKRFERTDGPALHPLLAREPGRFGRNVDNVFTRGRAIARSLGR